MFPLRKKNKANIMHPGENKNATKMKSIDSQIPTDFLQRSDGFLWA